MRNRLKHAVIAPSSYLHSIPEDFTHFHLVLAHLLDNEEYATYYRARSRDGAFIIVDNGAFEFKKPLEPDELFAFIKKGGFTPNVVVAPDYPNQPWQKTYKAALKFSREYTQYFNPMKTKLMVVPQSVKGDWRGWLQCYRELAHVPYTSFIGMSILGIPNAWSTLTKTDDISFNRIFCTEYLIREGVQVKSLKHHYLGCGDPRELLMMQQQGLAYSNDSSTAYWHGINRICFDDTVRGLADGKINKDVDFDIDFQADRMEYVEYNLEWIQKLLDRE